MSLGVLILFSFFSSSVLQSVLTESGRLSFQLWRLLVFGAPAVDENSMVGCLMRIMWSIYCSGVLDKGDGDIS